MPGPLLSLATAGAANCHSVFATEGVNVVSTTEEAPK